jgi:ABC-type sugar transport system substrate-binding protein
MLSRRKPLAALAAVTAALSIAVLTASASAATPAPNVDPTVCQLMNISLGPWGPGMFPGGASLDATLAKAGGTVGCQAQSTSPQQSLLPIP